LRVDRQVRSGVGKLIKALRAKLRKRLPAAKELVYGNYNFFVIGYRPTERPSDPIVSRAANSEGAGLFFYRGATHLDPKGVLLESGSQNWFIWLPELSTLDRPEVEVLIAASYGGARSLPLNRAHARFRFRLRPSRRSHCARACAARRSADALRARRGA
jgi:hypothetical protein